MSFGVNMLLFMSRRERIWMRLLQKHDVKSCGMHQHKPRLVCLCLPTQMFMYPKLTRIWKAAKKSKEKKTRKISFVPCCSCLFISLCSKIRNVRQSNERRTRSITTTQPMEKWQKQFENLQAAKNRENGTLALIGMYNSGNTVQCSSEKRMG